MESRLLHFSFFLAWMLVSLVRGFPYPAGRIIHFAIRQRPKPDSQVILLQAMSSNSAGRAASQSAGAPLFQSPPLMKYVPGMDVGALEEWPFDNPKSNYLIHDGTSPRASGRIDHSTPTTRTGIWRCTVGKMECTEQGEELMTILSGKVEVIDVSTSQVVLLESGDSLFSHNGKRVIWNVLEDVTKVFYGFKADGYS